MSPEVALMSAEANRRIVEALEELEEEYRLVVILCDVEEMNYAQIADVLDMPVGTVKSRLHRARRLLREKLADLVD
jgi:RNA polymerase sigma-70 factor (ECF subfamily)